MQLMTWILKAIVVLIIHSAYRDKEMTDQRFYRFAAYAFLIFFITGCI